VSLPLEHLGSSEPEWVDVLSDTPFVADDDQILRVPLDAYEVVWLTRRHR
jgi:hypothetical protein